MNKNIFKIATFFLLISSVVYTGCDKKKLDLMPNGPTEATYFSSENDFTRSVLGVYAKLTDLYGYNAGRGQMTLFLLPGDDITTFDANESYEVFSTIQASDGNADFIYTRIYQMIGRANVVLEKIAAVDASVYKTPNLKNSHKGEALFLRGLAHFYLWNYYGTAPLRTQRVVSAGDFKPGPSTGTQLLDQAIKDFTDAAALLPTSWDAGNRGRATANSANGYLGKSLVFRASATNAAADYTAAIAALNKVAGLSLATNFSDNFDDATENNSESLFEFQAAHPFAFNNVWLDNDFDNAIGEMSAFWGFYSNHWSLFGDIKRCFATTKLQNAFEPGDPRADITLNGDRTINKYVTMDNSTGGGPGSKDNYRLLRLADVKLLQAEAVLQSNGSTATAIGLINEVRTRARNGGGIPANYSAAETNKATIMGWIMNERFIELAGEGQRWLDLRRWHMGGSITLNSAYFSSNVGGLAFSAPKHLLLPIPLSELDVNPNMKQNTGY